MEKVLYFFAAFLCACLYSCPADAAYVTGEELVRNCRSEKPQEIFSCMNYIAGVVDYHVMMQSLGTAPTIDFCLPKNMPLEVAAVVVLLYFEKSPQHVLFIAAPAVTMALHESYPCGPVGGHKKQKKHD